VIRKNLQHIKLDSQKSTRGEAELCEAKVEGQKPLTNTQHPEPSFLTAEGIELKPTYSEQDIENPSPFPSFGGVPKGRGGFFS